MSATRAYLHTHNVARTASASAKLISSPNVYPWVLSASILEFLFCHCIGEDAFTLWNSSHPSLLPPGCGPACLTLPPLTVGREREILRHLLLEAKASVVGKGQFAIFVNPQTKL